MIEDAVKLLRQRGVSLPEIAALVREIQLAYYPGLTEEECLEAVTAVLKKREVQNAVLTGIALDMLTEQNLVPEPLGSIIRNDDFLYGVDEILALAITNVYGSIGLTNFGYLDKLKPGMLGRIDRAKKGTVNTFLDDLVAGIAAAAAARIAHNHRA